jgi:hypothetical protein
MKGHPWFRMLWYAMDAVLVVSLGASIYAGAWELTTRNYLKGFSDAVVPSTDQPEQKVEAILAWMRSGPARRTTPSPDSFSARDPEQTLNYAQLLQVCGTATNAFVNLAMSSGLQARRLLLLDQNRNAKHVVVEVFIDGAWVVVDPSYRVVFHAPDGRLLTRTELKVPAIFHQATEPIPNYPQAYTYEKTIHVHLRRIPWIGRYLRWTFNRVWPGWEEAINWTVLVERESFALVIVSGLLLCFGLAARLFLSWYCSRRLGVARVRLRDQLAQAGATLFSYPK